MNRKWMSRLLIVTTTATGAYYLGRTTERARLNSNCENSVHNDGQLFAHKEQDFLQRFAKKPGLPIFGTVSAAVPAPLPEVNLAATPSRTSQIMKYGFPSLSNVRSYSDYVLSYDTRNRVPNWVFEHLTPASVSRNDTVDRSKSQFRPDESVHQYFRADNKDYFRSGYDRGHMAAAGNHRLCQKHCDDTFYLTNMAPQVGQGFNRDAWNRLEMHVRKLTQTYPNVYVCTGPLYLPRKEEDGKSYVKYEVIGLNTVAVPTHFYKIVVGETAEHKLEMEAYVMPNKAISDDTPLQVFQVPPESIERASGLLFFDKVDRKQLAKINGKKT